MERPQIGKQELLIIAPIGLGLICFSIGVGGFLGIRTAINPQSSPTPQIETTNQPIEIIPLTTQLPLPINNNFQVCQTINWNFPTAGQSYEKLQKRLKKRGITKITSLEFCDLVGTGQCYPVNSKNLPNLVQYGDQLCAK